jgi:hypothetical protein
MRATLLIDRNSFWPDREAQCGMSRLPLAPLDERDQSDLQTDQHVDEGLEGNPDEQGADPTR